MDTNGAMIRIEGLKVRLGDREVLHKVELSVAGGETVALLGASGSGKSTLLRAAAGLCPVAAGEVWLGGKQVTGLSRAKRRELRRQVGMLFQGNALFDSMTVSENIGFVLKEVMELSAAEIDLRIQELLQRLRLGPIGRMYPAELSGGMKKRVGIARAIAHDPGIVFYDDPTAGLDPITSQVIADLIAELSTGETRAGIVASNYLPLVLKVAKRAVLLSEGKIIELGPAEKIMESEFLELKEFLDIKPGPAPSEDKPVDKI